VLGVPYEVWIWINVFIIAIGCIPEVGSAVKGVLRALIESLVAVTKKAGGLQAHHLQDIWARLVKVLGSLGIDEARAVAWLKQLPDKLSGWMSQATGKIKSALNAIQNLLTQAEDMALSRYAEWLLDKKTVQQLLDGIRRIKKAVQQAYSRLDTMKAEVNKWLREQLGKVLATKPPDATSAGELSDALRKSKAAAAQAEASYRAAVDKFRRALRASSTTLYSGVDPMLLLKMAQVGYAAARNGIKKFDVFRREQQLKGLANRIDFEKLTPKQVDELEAAFARGVDDEAAESAGKSFSGKLKKRGQVELPGVYTVEIKYTKRARKDYKALRAKFNSSVRAQFARSLGRDAELVAVLKKAGLTEVDIAKLKNGRIPKGYQVHHKVPLDDGGDNSFSNLVLIKNDPYHKVITNTANKMTKGLRSGQTLTVNYPIVPGVVYPA
jgi:predicted metal-dependent phosphoesterase TrpH